MEKWIKKNLRWITIVFIALFFIKSFQSCSRKASLRIQEKKLTYICDSVTSTKNKLIDSLDKENLAKEFMIKDLTMELKIAGIKVDEAQKRAEAIQKTASSIKSNTTIEVKGVERDK